MPTAVTDRSVSPDDLAGLIASFTEVTARLQATHEDLRAEVGRLNRELGEANAQVERSRRLAALGEMAAGIAHEVRNPLGSIRLYARMLEEDLERGSPAWETASKITRATRGVEQIVGDVLSFAREFRLRVEPVSPGELFDAALRACEHDGVPWRGVEVVRADAGPLAPRAVHADPGLLQQALTNIVRNAFEAMAEAPGPHRLTLDARADRVAERDGSVESCVVLGVSDTGPGVTPDVVRRMFNPFFTTRSAGTGLGLAIVHRIVDAHLGRVTVRNNADLDAGPGARVEIVLPGWAAPDEAPRGRGVAEEQE
ncbi:MAG: ATP-binding protein [Planctomycetota bacterium]|nr:ATP-binding protein [Planctomycetota bacterium]